jgi:hypothetical protein
MKKSGLLVIVAMMTVCGAGLSAQALSEAKKGDTVGWHEVRAGETLSGITGRYLGDSSLWRENHRLNPDIADPDRLTPGQRIRVILSREIAARRAEIEQVSRRVEKKPQSDDWINARAGDALVEREGLRTYPRSSAELGFDDGSNLVLTENSIVFLREYTSSLRRVDRSLIEVVDGGIDIAVTPKTAGRRGKEIEIVLGDVRAKPRPERNEPAKSRAVRDEADAKLMVYTGASAVESAGVTVNVAKGMGTSVRQGEAPAPPERLLAAPKLVSPATGSAVSGALEVAWAAVPKAAAYTFELCRDEVCGQLVDRQVNLTSTAARAAVLAAGDLYWRVTAKSASGLDGFPSKPFKVTASRLVAGRVVVDRAGTLDGASWTAAGNATVRLYGDDGDGVPDDGDSLVSEVRTDDAGAFSFTDAVNGTYWVVADSRSASPSGMWLEQVAGPAGSLCSTTDGGTRTLDVAGPCFGGRRGDASDDVSSLDGAEHIVRLDVSDEGEVASLDFVFSPSVVTTTEDGDGAPQGSLRRFMLNAAELSGDDAMRFVPSVPPGGDGKWWTITLAGDLPPVDESVTLDGQAWSHDGVRIDTNKGQVSDEKTVGATGEPLRVADLPELELVAAGASRPLVVRSGTLRVRRLAVFGSSEADLTSMGALEVENCLVGVGAGLAPAEAASAAAIELSGVGTADLSQLYLRTGGSFGILVRSESSEAKVAAKDLEIVNCGTVAVRVQSNGSVFERIHVTSCSERVAPIAFELKGARGADYRTCQMNRVTSSTVIGHDVGVMFRVGAMDNIVETTLFERVGRGVELELVMGFWVPKGNQLRQNTWRGVDETIALAGRGAVAGTKLFEGAVACADGGWVVDRALDFPGRVSAAREGDAIVVSASVCAEAAIEVYAVSAGEVRYLDSFKSDSSGRVEGRIGKHADVTRIGVLATDTFNTTSRMTFLPVE